MLKACYGLALRSAGLVLGILLIVPLTMLVNWSERTFDL